MQDERSIHGVWDNGAGGMTQERFAELAMAYGADIGRWPEGEREAARRLAGAEAAPGTASVALEAESVLDHLLWRATAASPSLALSDRVIALAPPARAAPGWLARWLTGVGVATGLAGACAAGVAMGVVFAPHALINVVTPIHAPPQGEEAAAGDAFGVDGAGVGDVG